MSGLEYGADRITYSGRTQTIRYQEIQWPQTRRGNCPVCGKRRTRSATFTATVSPFNKDPDTGRPRTPQQVGAALRAEAEAWVPDFSCQTHEAAEVCAVVGHPGPGTSSPTRCSYCRAEVYKDNP